MAQEKSSRRVSAFSSVHIMWPKKSDLSPFFESHIPSMGFSLEEGRRRITSDSLVSSASEALEPELETCLETPAEKELPEKLDEEAPAAPPEVPRETATTKSDRDSDSTICASKEDGTTSDQPRRVCVKEVCDGSVASYLSRFTYCLRQNRNLETRQAVPQNMPVETLQTWNRRIIFG